MTAATAVGSRTSLPGALVFFAILLTLALSSFSLIQYYTGGA